MTDSTAMTNVTESTESAEHSTLNGGTEDHSNKLNGLEEMTPELAAESVSKKGSSVPNSTPTTPNRSKKRKKTPRDATAPKQPLTGYFRFLNDRRERMRSENPTMAFAEITKALASEWNVLPQDQKQQYLDAAEQDKERYNREFNDYKQTEAYRIFSEKQSSEKQNDVKKERNGAETALETNDIQPEKEDGFAGFDIPIFTEEFLEHNKACEAELRQLRKATSDYEAQNAVLQRHVDSLHSAVERLENDTSSQRATNQALQRHLETLRTHLVTCFATIPLQGSHEGATVQNIDSYVERLETLLTTSVEPQLRTAIRGAVARLDFIK